MGPLSSVTSSASQVTALVTAEGEDLANTTDLAMTKFKENRELQKKVIETLTKANAEKDACLVEKDKEIAQLKAAHEKLLKAERVKYKTLLIQRIEQFMSKCSYLNDLNNDFLELLETDFLKETLESYGSSCSINDVPIHTAIANSIAKLKVSHHLTSGNIRANLDKEYKNKVNEITQELNKMLDELKKIPG